MSFRNSPRKWSPYIPFLRCVKKINSSRRYVKPRRLPRFVPLQSALTPFKFRSGSRSVDALTRRARAVNVHKIMLRHLGRRVSRNNNAAMRTRCNTARRSLFCGGDWQRLDYIARNRRRAFRKV